MNEWLAPTLRDSGAAAYKLNLPMMDGSLLPSRVVPNSIQLTSSSS